MSLVVSRMHLNDALMTQLNGSPWIHLLALNDVLGLPLHGASMRRKLLNALNLHFYSNWSEGKHLKIRMSVACKDAIFLQCLFLPIEVKSIQQKLNWTRARPQHDENVSWWLMRLCVWSIRWEYSHLYSLLSKAVMEFFLTGCTTYSEKMSELTKVVLGLSVWTLILFSVKFLYMHRAAATSVVLYYPVKLLHLLLLSVKGDVSFWVATYTGANTHCKFSA